MRYFLLFFVIYEQLKFTALFIYYQITFTLLY